VEIAVRVSAGYKSSAQVLHHKIAKWTMEIRRETGFDSFWERHNSPAPFASAAAADVAALVCRLLDRGHLRGRHQPLLLSSIEGSSLIPQILAATSLM
jgi:hypothetical protein